MNVKRLFYQYHRYLILVIIYLFLLIPRLNVCINEHADLTVYFLIAYGGIYDFTEAFSIFNLGWMVGNTIIIYTLSNLFVEDFRISYVYVLTRSHKKTQWLFRQTKLLLVRTLLTFAFLFCETLFIGFSGGLRPLSIGKFLACIVLLYLCNVGTLFLLSFLQNIFSLRVGGALAFSFAILFYLFPTILGYALYPYSKAFLGFYYIFPSTNQMLLWHIFPFRTSVQELLEINPIQNFLIWVSIGVIILWNFLCYIGYSFWFRKQDITSVIRGESE